MKAIASTLFLLFLSLTALNAQGDTDLIIPKPQLFKALEGTFLLSEQSLCYSDTSLSESAADYLQNQLLLNADFALQKGESSAHNQLYYRHNPRLKEEGYTLYITTEKILIEASSQAGFFYATVSLMQLMEPAIWSQKKAAIAQKTWKIPASYIEDYPRFRWRGMMLDSSRNFFSVDYVKKFIDRMAQHKLNLFHWHLTDDEGWRIEIKKYPLLTEVGARRGPGTKLPFSLYPAMRGPKDKMQEGYYTQEEIREVVAYAAKRSVAILPEIDIPAHSKAAVTAYPELLQDPDDRSLYTSVQKIGNNTMDAGLQSTYLFLEDVIKEVSALFPFEYIHLGGDEIPKGAWESSPAAARLMQKMHLKNSRELQAYLFTRMDKILAKYGRKMIAWQEVRRENSTLREETLIMAWRGDGAAAKAAADHQKVIMSPAQYLYFDQQYTRGSEEPGHTWAGPTDTRDAYSYNPADELSDQGQVHLIQGVHGCLWSETALTEEIADYLAWPRIFSLAEIGWSSQKQRSWKDFKSRAFGKGLKRLESQNIRYRSPSKQRGTES